MEPKEVLNEKFEQDSVIKEETFPVIIEKNNEAKSKTKDKIEEEF